jgi:hypothetical protein
MGGRPLESSLLQECFVVVARIVSTPAVSAASPTSPRTARFSHRLGWSLFISVPSWVVKISDWIYQPCRTDRTHSGARSLSGRALQNPIFNEWIRSLSSFGLRPFPLLRRESERSLDGLPFARSRSVSRLRATVTSQPRRARSAVVRFPHDRA